jgi:1-acyl-sn-glycerol-3-phosphate acyltransferase
LIETFLKSLSLRAVRRIAGAKSRWIGPKPSANQRIYCANHTSHLDAALLLAALPTRLANQTRPVAAADYWAAGRLRRYLTEDVFRSVMIQRESKELNPLAPVFQALRQGDSLIFFPEGTRGPGGFLQPLKPGIYSLARAFPKVEIVPVWIQNSSRVLPKSAKFPIPESCTLLFGEALSLKDNEDAAAFLLRLGKAMDTLRQQVAQ